jgi:hypothetical protein
MPPGSCTQNTYHLHSTTPLEQAVYRKLHSRIKTNCYHGNYNSYKGYMLDVIMVTMPVVTRCTVDLTKVMYYLWL